MATTITGETYLGDELVNTLSQSGDVTVYLWPMRCLKSKIGGPTFGVDVKGVEVIRFDCHGDPGHWHELGYDKLGAGGSHVDFPGGLKDTSGQIDWSLGQIRNNGAKLLDAAGYPDEAKTLDADMLKIATEGIKAHIATAGDLRTQAVEKGLLEA